MNTSRRGFFLSTGLGAGLAAAQGMAEAEAAPAAPGNLKGKQMDLYERIARLPNFCSHEHWGSITAIGGAPAEEGFRADVEAGAQPTRRTTVWDLVLDPYFTGALYNAGFSPTEVLEGTQTDSLQAYWEKAPAEALDRMRPHLRRQLLVGIFQCTRRGIQALHGADIATLELDAWQKADKSVAEAYDDIFAWYRRAMDQMNFSQLIRPVHPEFYVRKADASAAEQELAFTHTIMRIDPFLNLWETESPRRDTLAEMAGVMPEDAASWRRFLERIFEIAAEGNTTGIKQLQAYRRTLEFPQVEDSAVKWRGDLAPEEVTTFQNWVVNACCKLANDYGWPHQVHVGTHNMPQSAPLPLQDLARRYRNMDIVMIHCWPYLDEAGFLAKQEPNIYIDTCWQPVLSPQFFEQALQTWINYVPRHKITVGHDCTSVEMAAGSSLFTRETLARVLSEQIERLGLNQQAALETAADMLHNNAVRLYGIGEAVEL